ncbi:hypothetical protein BU17DRAFT_85085 [Hysterangium stoloniferum]|nr:hypothetical protein BU17DRAFT_85085 [Hysterangium stoloniferum]
MRDKEHALLLTAGRLLFRVHSFTLATVDFYELLSLPRHAEFSPSDVKQAYHRKLLRDHPDKFKYPPHELRTVTNQSSSASPSRTNFVDADTVKGEIDVRVIKEAYLTLSDPALRRAYDASLTRNAAPRPAQVVSLEDFVVSYDDPDGGGESTVHRYPCRCGGMYYVSEAQLEKDVHLVGCDACSEIIWVGYEVEEEQVGNDAGEVK